MNRLHNKGNYDFLIGVCLDENFNPINMYIIPHYIAILRKNIEIRENNSRSQFLKYKNNFDQLSL